MRVVVDLVPGAAGASSVATNTPAQGRITVNPAVAVVGDTLVSSMASVTDADGILEDTIAFRWTVELAPGSGVFEPTVNGVEAANAILFGDSSVDFGQNLAVVLINQSPPITETNLGSFVGSANLLIEPAQFVNQSVPDGNLKVTFIIPSVEVTGLAVDFGGVITASEQAYISEGISLRLDETVAVPPLTQPRTKEVYRPVARAHFDNGVVTQGVVDLVFEIEREVGSDLINGLTYATFEAPGLGSGQVHQWIHRPT